MTKRLLFLLTVCLTAATAVQAQPGGRGGGGHARAAKPFSEPDLIGVIKAIDAPAGRVTISYEPSQVLNWPAGTQPFPVSKTALLKGLTVGEKVRFRLESEQIATIRPVPPSP